LSEVLWCFAKRHPGTVYPRRNSMKTILSIIALAVLSLPALASDPIDDLYAQLSSPDPSVRQKAQDELTAPKGGCICGSGCSCPVCDCGFEARKVVEGMVKMTVSTVAASPIPRYTAISSLGRQVTFTYDATVGLQVPDGKGWLYDPETKTWIRPPAVAPVTYAAQDCGPQGCSPQMGYSQPMMMYGGGSRLFGGLRSKRMVGGGSCSGGSCR
jgi:hypothetical protein